ncbi:MAG: sigma 54-interacting transcriptional regulator [Planctomycetota bacterium]|jgi:transcriptional regulator with GAF, ATPase, and Fis domain
MVKEHSVGNIPIFNDDLRDLRRDLHLDPPSWSDLNQEIEKEAVEHILQLREALEDDKENQYIHFQLAARYCQLRIWGKVVTHLKESINFPRPPKPPDYSIVARHKLDKIERALDIKPCPFREDLIEKRQERASLIEKVAEDKRKHIEAIAGYSLSILDVFRKIIQYAPTDASVLITGETGTGKELVARAIHGLSGRQGQYVPVNVTAIPHELFESEMFGHVKGAFTGAVVEKKGKFEVAEGGTLFLDEVGDLSLGAQAKLLRAIDNKEIQKVGAEDTKDVDVRVVAATNRDLSQMVEADEFRHDLLKRLDALTIHIRPLRERLIDVEPILEHLIKENGFQGIPRDEVLDFTEHFERIEPWEWPCKKSPHRRSGNVRDLQNLLVKTYAENKSLKVPRPPSVHEFQKAQMHKTVIFRVDLRSLGRKLTDIEVSSIYIPREIDLEDDDLHKIKRGHTLDHDIRKARNLTKNDADAARLLGIAPATLSKRLKKLNPPN